MQHWHGCEPRPRDSKPARLAEVERTSDDDALVGQAVAVVDRLLRTGTVALVPGLGGPVGALLTELSLIRIERQLTALAEVVERLADAQASTAEEVANAIRAEPARTAMFLAAGEVIGTSEDELIRRMAGRVLLAGLEDDALVDECRVMMASLRQFEPAHLRVLGFAAERRMIKDHQLPPDPLTEAALVERWPQGEVVMPSVLAALESGGALRRLHASPREISEDVAWSLSGGSSRDIASDRWICTPYGERLAKFAIDAGVEQPPA